VLATFIFTLVATPSFSAVTPARTLTTCTDLTSGKQVVLQFGSCRPGQASAIWHIQQGDSASHTGTNFAHLLVCTAKNSDATYQLIFPICPKFVIATDYYRAISLPATPVIVTTTPLGYSGAHLHIALPADSADSPIAYYDVKNLTTGLTTRFWEESLYYEIQNTNEEVESEGHYEITLAGLLPVKNYIFSVTAVSIDGISSTSSSSQMITTGAVPPALPAFSLSSTSESRSLNTPITGYTISSTGGAIASYAIRPAAPTGLTFSAATGLLSGTPTSVVATTTYTITATNASGSATATFILTVVDDQE
jgi:hypothetical protein